MVNGIERGFNKTLNSAIIFITLQVNCKGWCFFFTHELFGLFSGIPLKRVRKVVSLRWWANHIYAQGSYTYLLALTLSNKVSESNMTLLPLLAMTWEISRAVSILFKSKKPGLFLIASPISSALLASPWARTIMDCFSCLALSTTKAALCASCWAICLASTAPSKPGLWRDG
jgi:hypothetical protein